MRPPPPRPDFKIIRRKASSRDLYVLRRYTENSMEFVHQPEELGLSSQTVSSDGRSWRQWLNDREFYKVICLDTGRPTTGTPTVFVLKVSSGQNFGHERLGGVMI